jgi:hypothetical protein
MASRSTSPWAEPVCGVRNPTQKIRKGPYILLIMMEDVMTDHTDTHSLYVLLVSLLGTVISLPAVWYFAAAASAAPGLVA